MRNNGTEDNCHKVKNGGKNGVKSSPPTHDLENTKTLESHASTCYVTKTAFRDVSILSYKLLTAPINVSYSGSNDAISTTINVTSANPHMHSVCQTGSPRVLFPIWSYSTNLHLPDTVQKTQFLP